MTIPQWRAFLQQWSEEWLARDEKFPARLRKSRWLGYKPASERQVEQLEKRLGYRLPPSYRNFLLTTNGWTRTSDLIQSVRPASKVDWLQNDNPQLLDVSVDEQGLDDYSPAEYFSYDGRPIYDEAHFRESLIIADPVPGDSMIYVLNPLVVAEDGEWEAWRFAHWIPGAERFPSFELLMRAEHASFLQVNGESAESFSGPYEGVYAPDRPRGRAARVGRGRPRRPRLTIPQLIAQLESPDPKARLDAAEQLSREFCPHDPQNEHPELVAPLGRLIRSTLETEVRSAAALMLGSYGDTSAIPLLIEALDDPELTGAAISALFYLSIDMPDPRIGDAMVRLVERRQDCYVVDHVFHILEELEDGRVAEIGLRLLDRPDEVSSSVSASAENAEAAAHQRLNLRYTGAFAFARFARQPTAALLERLTNPSPEIRAAAVAAIREDPHKGSHLERHLTPLLRDADATVRQQAETTIQSLEPLPQVEISQAQLDQVRRLADSFRERVASRKKDRF